MSPRIIPEGSEGLIVLDKNGLDQMHGPRAYSREALGGSASNLLSPATTNLRSMSLSSYFNVACVVDKIYESNCQPSVDKSQRASLLSLVENLVDRYNIRAVFWDADGTLFHTEFAQFKLFQLALEKEGSSFSLDENQRRMVSSDWKKDFIPGLNKKLAEAGSSLEVGELMDSVFSPISTMFEHYKETMLRPGIMETLTWLQNKNIPCGIATLSTREQLRERLIKSGIYSFFHTTLSVDELDLSKRKPHPESLIKLAEASGISTDDYDRCLVIGDTQNDFTPAKNLGMRWICYDDTAMVDRDLRKKHHVHDPLQRLVREMDDFSGLILPRRPREQELTKKSW